MEQNQTQLPEMQKPVRRTGATYASLRWSNDDIKVTNRLIFRQSWNFTDVDMAKTKPINFVYADHNSFDMVWGEVINDLINL